MFLFTPSKLVSLSDNQLNFLYKAAHIRLFRSEAGTLERAKALAEIEAIIQAMNLKRVRRPRLVARNG